ncbi:MAG: glycosyltransferase [Alphaproteobacteria bacterium]|nr:glycosyltransferase [Alphaproteobacteria bacterium]MBT4018913.1 glycosyltransferase [Alphaproteobacteria bacterium]
MQKHLVIMVKVPQIGATKTRLAAGIGPLAAWRFYRNTTDQVIRRLGRHGLSSKWKIWLAVTPERLAANTRFWPVGVQWVGQGPGDLGQRMASSMLALPPGPVVLIGSDVPGIQPTHIASAFDALEYNDIVFGPAEDGGFWLVGLKRRPFMPGRLRPGLFRCVRWSSDQALEDTIAGLDPRYRVARISTLSDVDTAEDLRRWQQSQKK